MITPADLAPDNKNVEGTASIKAKHHYNSHKKGAVKKSSSLLGLKKAASVATNVPDMPSGVTGPALP